MVHVIIIIINIIMTCVHQVLAVTGYTRCAIITETLGYCGIIFE